MDEKIFKKLEEQDAKMDAIYKSIEKIRKIFLTTAIISIATFVLPIIGLMFIIPWFLNVMSEAYSGLL